MPNPENIDRSRANQPGAATGEPLKSVANAAANSLDDTRNAAASGLKSAADYIGDKIGNIPGGESVQRTAAVAADSLTASADYLRDNSLNSMVADLEEVVKRNPGPALLAAGVLGLLVGRALSR